MSFRISSGLEAKSLQELRDVGEDPRRTSASDVASEEATVFHPNTLGFMTATMTAFIQVTLYMASMHPSVTNWTFTSSLSFFNAQSAFLAHSTGGGLSLFNDAMFRYLNWLILYFGLIVKIANAIAASIVVETFFAYNEALSHVGLSLRQ